MFIVVIIIAIGVWGYNRYLTPPPMPDPLFIVIDGEEILDSEFDASYDYTGLAKKSTEVTVPVNWDEFSDKREDTVIEYTSDSIAEAWTKIDYLEAPEYSKGLAEWVCNGTMAESGLRYYGDIHTFWTWASGKHITASIGSETALFCEFEVRRKDRCFYDREFEEHGIPYNQEEVVVLEKWYNMKLESGAAPVWAYIVFIETENPVRSVLIQFKR